MNTAAIINVADTSARMFSYLTSDNQMTPKPNLALNAEIESSGRAANSARCNDAPEPAMTVTSRNLQVITGRAAREGARERVCFAQKQPIAATKMALWATQQPQRGGTTSCASRPSAGIDRAKCLISLKATGEQVLLLCTVTHVPPRWYQVTLSPADPGGGVAYGS